MIAKFNGTCRVTGQPIVGGETEIAKIDGVWQIKPTCRPLNVATKCPPSKARHSFLHRGIECHVYLYVGQYGHWKVWKLEVVATGELIDLTQRHLDFANDGSNFRNPVGSTQQQAERHVRGRIDWWMDVDGERTAFEAEQKRRADLGYLY